MRLKHASLLLALMVGDGRAETVHRQFKLLVIHSYQAGVWTTESTQGIRNAFRDRKVDFTLRDYIFDYYSYKPEGREGEVAKVMTQVQTFKPDLIFVFDDEAADSLVSVLNESQIPMVLSGINKSQAQVKWWLNDGHTRRNFTGVWERYPFAQSLQMLARISPKINKISLLTGDNESAQVITKQLEHFFESHGNKFAGIAYDKTFMSSKWSKWKEVIRNYKGTDKAFWIVSPWNINGDDGREIDLRQISKFYHSNSKLPTLAIASVNQQLGFLASFAVSSEDLGYQAGEVALKILVRKLRPSDISFEDTKTARFVINKDRATKLGYRIPIDLLEFATIEKKIPMKFVR